MLFPSQFGFRTTIPLVWKLEVRLYCPNSKTSYFHEHLKIGVNSVSSCNYCGKRYRKIKIYNCEPAHISHKHANIQKTKIQASCISYLICHCTVYTVAAVWFNFGRESDYIIVWPLVESRTSSQVSCTSTDTMSLELE